MDPLLLILLFIMENLIPGNYSLQMVIWNQFVTSKSYENTILVTEFVNPLASFNIPNNKPLVLARMECSQACLIQSSCVGFNFYAQGDVNVCQLLQENFCAHQGRVALQVWPGGSVWDKLLLGVQKSCLDQQFVGKIASELCETMRPGCRGTWPVCNDCVRSCYNCRNNRSYSTGGFYGCTLWPEGSLSNPLFSSCTDDKTYLFFRGVNFANGLETYRYFMPFNDVERLTRLNVYHTLHFYFEAIDRSLFWAVYNFSYIDSNGKVTDLKFLASSDGLDGLGLNNQVRSLDFVTVNSDPYGCGSFWLLDPSNATFCPGGKVSVVGAIQKQVSAGIRWPSATGKILTVVDMKLGL